MQFTQAQLLVFLRACVFKHKTSLSLNITEAESEFMPFQWWRRNTSRSYHWIPMSVQRPSSTRACVSWSSAWGQFTETGPGTIVWPFSDGYVKSYYVSRGIESINIFPLTFESGKQIPEHSWEYCTVTFSNMCVWDDGKAQTHISEGFLYPTNCLKSCFVQNWAFLCHFHCPVCLSTVAVRKYLIKRDRKVIMMSQKCTMVKPYFYGHVL